jgi:hypothetical protein
MVAWLRIFILFWITFLIDSVPDAQMFIPTGFWGGAQIFSIKYSTLVVSSATLWVGDVITLTVNYNGQTGQVIPFGFGHTVTISSTGAGTSVGTISAVTDNGNGTYSATLTGNTIGTAKNLTATIDGVTLGSVLPTFTVTESSCAALLAAGFSASGAYTIDVDGGGGATLGFTAYCDQTTDGGGWMLVAIPRRNTNTFAEATGLVDPTVAGPQRVSAVWSDTNTAVTFTKLRLTNAAPGSATKTNIADFTVSQSFGGLMAAYPTYNQTNVVVSGASITSNIGSTCFIIRGKSGAFAIYDDNADWLFMGFHSVCATPFSKGDTWDDDRPSRASGPTQWTIGARDDGDGLTANHAVGINTSKVDWEYSVGGSVIDNKTIVWIK